MLPCSHGSQNDLYRGTASRGSPQMTKQHHFQMTKQDPWYENHYPHMTQQEHWFEKLKDGALFLNYQIQVLCLLIHNMFIVHHIAQKRQNAAC